MANLKRIRGIVLTKMKYISGHIVLFAYFYPKLTKGKPNMDIDSMILFEFDKMFV